MNVSGDAPDAGQGDQAGDQQRPAVTDCDPDPRHATACSGLRDDGERRVVVDERGLVREVRDGEQDEPDRGRVGQGDQRGRDDRDRGEDQQVRESAPASVADRAQDRRHDRIDQDADRGRDAEPELAIGRPETVDRPEAHRVRHDGVGEDRVGEVVQGPRRRDDRAATRRQPGKAADAGLGTVGRETVGRGGGGHGRMIRGACPTTMASMTDDDAIALARSLRLQWFGKGSTDRIHEPVVEPLWSGLRVIAAAHDGKGVLLDDGQDVPGHDELAGALATTVAATATGVILDAYVTKQIASEEPGVGVYTGLTDLPSAGNMLMGSLVGRGRRPRRVELAEDLDKQLAQQHIDEGEPVNLVAVDLLWLDGEWLLEAPLLERKRLLEAVLPGDPLIRPGVYVRPPIERWVGSWRAQGFRGLAFKGANSRYRPGEVAQDWTTRPMPRR